MSAKIKICGIKSLFEARAVLDCGARGEKVDFIGLIFAPSKRKVSVEVARDISNLALEADVKSVGVFVGQSAEQIVQIARECNLAAVQIYEDLDFSNLNGEKSVREVKFEIWRAFSVSDELPNISNLKYDLVLFDALGASKGGNGIKFDWNLLSNLNGSKLKWGLAGGLSEQNTREALKYRPWLLDFNSRIEDENGFKIPEKIKEILKINGENNEY